MDQKKKLKYLKVFLVFAFIVSLAPAFVRNTIFMDAHGLIFLSVQDPNSFDINPYSENGIYIRPRAAIWLLSNFDFPYKLCLFDMISGCSTTGLYQKLINSRTNEKHQQLDHQTNEIMTILLKKGIDLNTPDYTGWYPLHSALLSNNQKLVKQMLENGADPKSKIKSSGLSEESKFVGYDVLQMAKLLEKKNSGNFIKIIGTIESYYE
tara:strand:- start:75 stop:698 length:624 start_codon:yes stop_codon:yes gene_type:complete